MLTAFGMGLDCPHIQYNIIVHWGLPSSLEEYALEAIRDGDGAAAILSKGKVGHNADLKVKDYVRNTKHCR